MNWANTECKRRHGKDSSKTDPEAMRDVLGEALSLIRDDMELSIKIYTHKMGLHWFICWS